jgi:hypothetical protein
MAEIYDYERTLSVLKQVVAEEGDEFVYGAERREFHDQIIDCYYINSETGEGDCGVGRFMLKVGVDPKYLIEREGDAARTVVRGAPGITITMPALDLLVAFQEAQDEGVPWGEALRRAMKRIQGK